MGMIWLRLVRRGLVNMQVEYYNLYKEMQAITANTQLQAA